MGFPISPIVDKEYIIDGKTWIYKGDLVFERKSFDNPSDVNGVLYVSKGGNDDTALRNSFTFHFLTITAAKEQAVSGDLIIVFPGIYNDNEILKDGINYYFYSGTILTGDALHVPSGLTGITANVFGQAKLEGFRSISVEGDDTTLYIECGDIINDNSFGIRAWHSANLNLTVKCGDVKGTRSISIAGTGTSGNVSIYCRNILESISEGTCVLEGIVKGFIYVEENIYGPPALNNVNTISATGSNGEYYVFCNKLIDTNRSYNSSFPYSYAIGAFRGKLRFYGDIECNGVPAIGNGFTGGTNVDVEINGDVVCTEGFIFFPRLAGKFRLNGTMKSIDYVAALHPQDQACDLILNGRFICENEGGNSNVIWVQNSPGTTIRVEEAYLESNDQSIGSNNPLDVTVENLLHYNQPMHENVNLIEINKKFPEPKGTHNNIPKFNSEGRLREEYEVESALTNNANKIPNSLAVYAAIQAAQAGLDPKNAADVSTTENITLSGIQILDTVLGEEDMRVLVRHQNNTYENGLYLMKSGAWERTSDADTWSALVGAYVLVLEGQEYSRHAYYCNIPTSGDLGTDPIIFVIFTLPGEISISNIGSGVELLSSLNSDYSIKTLSVDNTPELNILIDGDEVKFNIDFSNYLTEETDPTVDQHIKDIQQSDINNWNEAYGWGNHATQGYITTETDPTVPSHVKDITETNIEQWNLAHGWGNHAVAGYLTSETDPTVPLHVKNITETNIQTWTAAFNWGDHSEVGYLTSIPNHNEIPGLQGGSPLAQGGQYYHLTESQHNKLHSRKHNAANSSDHEMTNYRILGNNNLFGGTGDVMALTTSQIRAMLNIVDGADNYDKWIIYRDGLDNHDINSGNLVEFVAGDNISSITASWNQFLSPNRYRITVNAEDQTGADVPINSLGGVTSSVDIAMNQEALHSFHVGNGNNITVNLLNQMSSSICRTVLLHIAGTSGSATIDWQVGGNPLPSASWQDNITLIDIYEGYNYLIHITNVGAGVGNLRISYIEHPVNPL